MRRLTIKLVTIHFYLLTILNLLTGINFEVFLSLLIFLTFRIGLFGETKEPVYLVLQAFILQVPYSD